MGKKDKIKNSETEKLKAGDTITTDQGESFELDKNQADSLNDQIENGQSGVGNSKEKSAPKKVSKNTGIKAVSNGTFRFNKFKGK